MIENKPTLKEFLNVNKPSKETKTIVFKGGRLDGMEMSIKTLPLNRFKELTEQVESYEGTKFDFTIKSVLEGVTNPDFRNSEWIKENDVETPEQLLESLLTFAEINKIGDRILEVSGITSDFDMVYKEAKN